MLCATVALISIWQRSLLLICFLFCVIQHFKQSVQTKWGLAVRLSVSPAFSSLLIITPVHMYTHAEILIRLLLMLMLLLTFILRNSCKVKQNQPMQKDFGRQVRTEYLSTAHPTHVLILALERNFLLSVADSVCCCWRTTIMETTPLTRRNWQAVSNQTRTKAVSKTDQWTLILTLCSCVHVKEPHSDSLKPVTWAEASMC